MVGAVENAVPYMVFERLRDVDELHIGGKRLFDGEKILLLAVRRGVFRKIVTHDIGRIRNDHRGDVQIVVTDGKIVHRVEGLSQHGGVRCGRNLHEIPVITEVDTVGFAAAEEGIHAELAFDPAVSGEKLVGKRRFQRRHKAAVGDRGERGLGVRAQLAIFIFGEGRFRAKQIDQPEQQHEKQKHGGQHHAVRLAVSCQDELLALGIGLPLFFGCVHRVTSFLDVGFLRTVHRGRTDR